MVLNTAITFRVLQSAIYFLIIKLLALAISTSLRLPNMLRPTTRIHTHIYTHTHTHTGHSRIAYTHKYTHSNVQMTVVVN